MRVLAMAAAALFAVSTAVVGSPAAHAAGAPMYRYEVIDRARSWLTANNGIRVPYDQNRTWTDGYRMDCSGYVSMAARLDKPGPNTVELNTSTWTASITMSQLKRGDLVIDAIGDGNNRHVVIFDRWTDANKVRYFAFEQRGDHGTDYRSLTTAWSPTPPTSPAPGSAARVCASVAARCSAGPGPPGRRRSRERGSAAGRTSSTPRSVASRRSRTPGSGHRIHAD